MRAKRVARREEEAAKNAARQARIVPRRPPPTMPTAWMDHPYPMPAELILGNWTASSIKVLAVHELWNMKVHRTNQKALQLARSGCIAIVSLHAVEYADGAAVHAACSMCLNVSRVDYGARYTAPRPQELFGLLAPCKHALAAAIKLADQLHADPTSAMHVPTCANLAPYFGSPTPLPTPPHLFTETIQRGNATLDLFIVLSDAHRIRLGFGV
ncbi:hypothetical protein H9P43_006934 [Blastocladiella emersonii ATCC 22665]|nr:hypothetical protein H9P43_006934 [Blastocladiella emersonii ATCC 22665]